LPHFVAKTCKKMHYFLRRLLTIRPTQPILIQWLTDQIGAKLLISGSEVRVLQGVLIRANRILRQFREKGILVTIEEGAGSKSAVVAFARLLNIAEGRDVF
jgi:hypothetical protein